MKSRVFNKSQMEFIKKNCGGKQKKETLEILNKEFGTNFYLRQLTGFMERNKITTGLNGRFEKGRQTWNKGSKGEDSTRWVPVGTEKVRENGYVEVKIAEPSVWEAKNRLVYQEHFGRIPDGYGVMFLNQDPTDCRIQNLRLVSKRKQIILNKSGLLSNSEVSNESSLLIADIFLKISDLKKSGGV